METSGSMSVRKKVALVVGLAAAGIVAAGALYVGGVGGGTELDGVRFVLQEDGTVRLRVHGVGVGMTRDEVDASPLAAGLSPPGTTRSLYVFPGEPGTTAAVLPEWDEEGRVKHLSVHYEGGRLALMRVASRYRALFQGVGGTCAGHRCTVTADPERTELAAVLTPGGTFVAVSALR